MTGAGLLLGIETSCDETAAAVVVADGEVRSTVVSSQIDLHAAYGGVVPEIAGRAHLELLPAVLAAALDGAGLSGAGPRSRPPWPPPRAPASSGRSSWA